MPYSYENFYPGLAIQPSIQQSPYSDIFTGYRVPAGKIGTTLNPTTANQLAELTRRLNTGLKVIEAGALRPDVFEAIPKQHFEEMGRLAKLAGAEVTLHSPIVPPYGTGEALTEEFRKIAEEHLWDVVQKAKLAKSPTVTIHITATPELGPVTRKVNGKEVVEAIPVVDTATGKIAGYVRAEEITTPEAIVKGKRKISPEERLAMLNESQLRNTVLAFDRNVNEIGGELFDISLRKREIESALSSPGLSENQKKELMHLKSVLDTRAKHLSEQLNHMVKAFEETFSTIYDVSSPDVKAKLARLAKNFENLKPKIIQGDVGAFTHVLSQLNEIASMPDVGRKIKFLSPAEDRAAELSAKTIANLAAKAYKKFGENAPALCLENVFPEWGLSRAKKLREVIQKARQQFIEQNKAKLGEQKAREIAEKLIGVTWDIGHINMLKKYGYSDEDIAAETKEIAKFVKHVHVTDNFGFYDSHLPAGMGNVPIKKALKEIEKQTQEKLRFIHEAGGFINFFRGSDVPYALEALGSPLYTYMQAPFWNQFVHTTPGYFASFEYVFPETHTYGFGFSALPAELGGQARGGQGFSQAPME